MTNKRILTEIFHPVFLLYFQQVNINNTISDFHTKQDLEIQHTRFIYRLKFRVPFTFIWGAGTGKPRKRYFGKEIIRGQPTRELATILGTDAYNNAYTLSSFLKFAQTQNPADLEIAEVKPIQPEQVKTIEFGYRGELIKNLGIDFSVYHNEYKNFGASTRVMALASEVGNVHDASAYNAIGTSSYKVFQLYTNTNSNRYFLTIRFWV